MWKQYSNIGNLTVDLELTTHCNLRCPQCSRTDEKNNLNPYPFIALTSVTLDQFKSWFSPEDLRCVKYMHFSGTYGDPGMCKDLLPIVEYIISNSKTNVGINTNGTMRGEDFWWDIGSIGKERLRVIFDIDGINQDMHSTYRRGSDLEKVLSAVEAVSMTPAKVTVLTVLFKHNQDYLDQIQDMAQSRAFKQIDFDYVEGNQFQNSNVYKFQDEYGNEQQLEQVTRKDREQGLERFDRRVRDHRHTDIATKYDSIECLSLKNKNIKVTAGGQVSPCCYLSTPIERAINGNLIASTHITSSGKHGDLMNPLIQDFVDNWKSFNLNHSNFLDVLDNQWFKDLKKSWSDTKSVPYACAKVCGKCS